MAKNCFKRIVYCDVKLNTRPQIEQSTWLQYKIVLHHVAAQFRININLLRISYQRDKHESLANMVLVAALLAVKKCSTAYKPINQRKLNSNWIRKSIHVLWKLYSAYDTSVIEFFVFLNFLFSWISYGPQGNVEGARRRPVIIQHQ